MNRATCCAAAVIALGLSCRLSAATVTFNFDSDATGKATAFTDTVGGISATFTSPADPGGFAIFATFFQSLTGNVLLDPGPAGLNNLGLAIQFSTPLTLISLNFATNSAAGVLLNLSAFNGASLVGSSSASGIIPAGFTFPEGILSFAGGPFDRVTLSSTALDFAIDNVTVTSAVPEPAPLFPVLATLGALIIAYSRYLRGGSSSARKAAA